MIKEALEYIVNLSAPHLEFRNGSHYADRALHRIPNELTASPLAVHTLSAVRDYIESGRMSALRTRTASAAALLSTLRITTACTCTAS